MLAGKRLECKKAKPKAIFGDYNGVEANLITKKIFVGGILEGTPIEEVKQAFSGFGQIVDSIMLPDRQSESGRCYVFLTFDTPFAVEAVMENYFDIRVAGRWVSYF